MPPHQPRRWSCSDYAELRIDGSSPRFDPSTEAPWSDSSARFRMVLRWSCLTRRSSPAKHTASLSAVSRLGGRRRRNRGESPWRMSSRIGLRLPTPARIDRVVEVQYEMGDAAPDRWLSETRTPRQPECQAARTRLLRMRSGLSSDTPAAGAVRLVVAGSTASGRHNDRNEPLEPDPTTLEGSRDARTRSPAALDRAVAREQVRSRPRPCQPSWPAKNRWTPPKEWPDLPDEREGGHDRARSGRPPSGSRWRSRAGPRWPLQSAAATSRGVPARGSVVVSLRSRRCSCRAGTPSSRPASTSRAAIGNGRFSAVHQWPDLGVHRGCH